jgi:hypothetical protein
MIGGVDLMTKALRRPLLDVPKGDGDTWRRGIFDGLVALIGAHKANELATRFRLDLGERFADGKNRERIRRDAHAVASTAEVLGFLRLSRAARSLEAAYERGGAFDRCLKALVIARGEAINALSSPIASHQTAT